MKRCSLLLYVVLGFSVCSWRAAAGTCNGEIEGPDQRVISSYSPFSPNDLIANQAIGIRNTGTIPCRFRVRFIRTSIEAKLSSTIQYHVKDASGLGLLIGENELLTSSQSILSPEIGPSNQTSINFSIEIPRGQLATPGNYDDTFFLILQSSDDDAELDKRAIRLILPVEAVVSLNISGGALSTTVDFGILENGKSRSIILEARSNENYTLKLSSQNRSRLRLDPPKSDQDWAIAYGMTVDGTTADLAGDVALAGDGNPLLGVQTHSLAFQIFDATNKRAGIYKDVVTATIAPVH